MAELRIIEDHNAGRQRIVAEDGEGRRFVCWTGECGPGYPDGEWRHMREDETPGGRPPGELARALDRELREHRRRVDQAARRRR